MFEERRERLSGGELAYLFRDGEGPAIVLLHGAGHRAAHLSALASSLAERSPARAIVIVEARGRGMSEGPPLDDLESRAAEIIELLERLQSERAILIGHSLGGGLAIEIALRAEAKIAALILIATGARLRVRPEILEAVGRGGLPLDPYSAALNADERARLLALEASVPTESALSDWVAADAFDRMNEIETITLPSLILVGSDDPMTPPKYARYLESKMPNAELHILEGEGHMMPMESPAEVAASIERFLHFRAL